MYSHEYSNLICQLAIYNDRFSQRQEFINKLSDWICSIKDKDLQFYKDAYFSAFKTHDDAENSVAYFWSDVRNGKYANYCIGDRYAKLSLEDDAFTVANKIQDYVESIHDTNVTKEQVVQCISELC